jgi:hypothetical protein
MKTFGTEKGEKSFGTSLKQILVMIIQWLNNGRKKGGKRKMNLS